VSGAVRAALAGLVAAGAAAAWVLSRPAGDALEVVDVRPIPGEPAMCPWRAPREDMAALFPDADRWQTETVSLARARRSILARLGPGGQIESNTLYVHRVFRGPRHAGFVMVRRFAGGHGGVEVVVGVDPDGRVAGVRVQRHREPPSAARVLARPGWLDHFRGKTASSALRIGSDLPAPSEPATATAEALARTVRSLLIELAESAPAGQTPHQ